MTARDPKHEATVVSCFVSTRRPARPLAARCAKLASGKVNDWESLGLLSSPTVEGDRVYSSQPLRSDLLDVNGMANGNDGPFKTRRSMS